MKLMVHFLLILSSQSSQYFQKISRISFQKHWHQKHYEMLAFNQSINFIPGKQDNKKTKDSPFSFFNEKRTPSNSTTNTPNIHNFCTIISRIAVGETPSPSLDCLNFFMAIDLDRFSLIFAKKTKPYVPSPIFPITSYCSSHSGLLPPLLLLELLALPSPISSSSLAKKSALFFRIFSVSTEISLQLKLGRLKPSYQQNERQQQTRFWSNQLCFLFPVLL